MKRTRNSGPFSRIGGNNLCRQMLIYPGQLTNKLMNKNITFSIKLSRLFIVVTKIIHKITNLLFLPLQKITVLTSIRPYEIINCDYTVHPMHFNPTRTNNCDATSV